jgi:hypothetical protein
VSEQTVNKLREEVASLRDEVAERERQLAQAKAMKDQARNYSWFTLLLSFLVTFFFSEMYL